MTIHILHLDDDIQVLDRFAKILTQGTILGAKATIDSIERGDELKKRLTKGKLPDIIILDLYLEGQSHSGLDLASMCRKHAPDAAIVVASSSKDLKSIRSSLKMGADDFIAKDTKPAELIQRLESVLKERRTQKISADASPLAQNAAGSTVSAIRLRVPQIVLSAVNCIYVQGESGTGKEVVANLFEEVLRGQAPFVRVNCGAISPSLIASELFGHVKGAFTGATADKAGLIESASGGWIFLDEVASLPLDAQVYLLRAIDNQSIRRLGANIERPMSFRVISATNEPLASLVEQGKFRRDLWQRLRETQIELPSLRERKHEIPELIDFFTRTMRGGPYTLAPTVLEALCAYDWREGNVRELRNCLRAMTEKSINKVLTPNSIPEHIWDAIEGTKKPSMALANPSIPSNAPEQSPQNVGAAPGDSGILLSWSGQRPEFERLSDQLLVAVLKQEFLKRGQMSVREAGRLTGIPRSTMSTKIRSLLESGAISDSELNQIIQMQTNLKNLG